MRWVFRILRIYIGIIAVIIILFLAAIFIPGMNPLNLNSSNAKVPAQEAVPKSIKDASAPPFSSGVQSNSSGSSMAHDAGKTEKEPGTDAVPGNPDDYFLTSDEVMAMENISLLDKIAGMSILSKLSMDEIDEVYAMAENGLTYEEIERVRSILEKHMDQKDIQKLNDILIRNKRLYAEGKLASAF